MKKILCYALLVLLAVGCKGKNDPTDPTKVDIVGNQSSPAWTAISEFDPLISMTMLVDVDLNLSYPEQVRAFEAASETAIVGPGDKMAVFSEEQCLAVTELNDDGNFYLYVAQPKSQTVRSIQLRYYSAALKNIFVSEETYSFANETQLGTYANPFMPKFILLTDN